MENHTHRSNLNSNIEIHKSYLRAYDELAPVII